MEATTFFRAPAKIVPFSETTFEGVPHLARNLSIFIMKELKSRGVTASMCTAVVVRQVKKKPIFSQYFCVSEYRTNRGIQLP